MSDFKLKAELKTEKPNVLRQLGFVPGVVYGKKYDSQGIKLDEVEFNKIFKAAGTSNLIELHLEDKKFKVLVHDYQVDPVKGNVLHVDFLKVNMKEKIHAEIPLVFSGDSAAVIDLEGSLITSIDSIEVECLPGDLISEINVDLSALDNFEKNIKISDLNIPAGIEVLTDADETVAFVQEPRSEEEMEELNEEVVENLDAIEVENKGEAPATEGEEEKKAE